MTTKENYVLQVFQYLLSRFPSVCHQEVTVPSYATFGLESVPPQFDPYKVQLENPAIYNDICTYIIDSHLKLYDYRRHQRCRKNLKNLLKALGPEQVRRVVRKFLCLVGLDHRSNRDWAFLDDDSALRRKMPHRAKFIHQEMIPVIRKALCDFAWRDTPIPNDVVFFMRAMTQGAPDK